MPIVEDSQDVWVASPGFMDAHVHPRAFDVQTEDNILAENLGYEGKAGLRQTSEVALRAGFTAMAAMGNETLRLPDADALKKTVTVPYTIGNRDRVLAYASRICGESVIPTGLNVLLDPAEIIKTEHGEPTLDIDMVDRRLIEMDPYSLATKVFLADSFGGFTIPLRFGAVVAHRAQLIHPGKPTIFHVEGAGVGRLLQDVQGTPGGRHFAVDLAHISSQQEMEAAIQAKNDHMNVHIEMTPHHGLLTERSGSVVKPDLKTAKDVNFLLAHLQYVDRFGSDNAPHRPSDKLTGTPGLANHSFMLPFLLALTQRGRLTMDELFEKLSTNPRRRFGVSDDGSEVVINASGQYQSPDFYDVRSQATYEQNPLLQLSEEQRQRIRLMGRVVSASTPTSYFDEIAGERMRPSYGNLLVSK